MEARSQSVVEELKMLQSPLAGMPVGMPFEVPGGYFSEWRAVLALRILHEASPELPEIRPAFGVLKVPFRVPAAYFDQFPASVREALEVLSLEERLPRQNAFSVPAGYFESLSQNILEVVRETPDFPEKLSSEMPFEVPAGYFDQLAASLHARLQAAEGPERIPLRPRRSLTVPLMRWAAAAILILGVALGIQQAGTPQTMSQTTRRALAAIPENALDEYVSQHADDFDMDMIEARLPQSTFQKASPVQSLNTGEIQSFLYEEALL